MSSNSQNENWKLKVDLAANTNLLDFLFIQSIHVEKKGNSYFVRGLGHKSLTILPDIPHMFKHFSTGETNNAIVFCQRYLNMNFKEAVESLIGDKRISDTFLSKNPNKVKKAREPFIEPKKADNYKWLFYELINNRKLSLEVVQHFVDQNTLYQSLEPNSKSGSRPFSSITFLVKDFDNNIVGAIKRGFDKGDYKGFKGNHKNSNTSDYGFLHKGTTSTLYIFEAPIDMLSYMSMMAKNNKAWQKDSFIALGTTYTGAVKNYLKNIHIDKIVLCQDSDIAGIEGRLKVLGDLESLDFKGKVLTHMPQGKDWNEDLINSVKSMNCVETDKDVLNKLLDRLRSKKNTINEKEQILG